MELREVVHALLEYRDKPADVDVDVPGVGVSVGVGVGVGVGVEVGVSIGVGVGVEVGVGVGVGAREKVGDMVMAAKVVSAKATPIIANNVTMVVIEILRFAVIVPIA